MTLKARQSRFPFILLVVMSAIGIFACLWNFVHADNFSVYGFLQLFGILVIVIIPLCIMAVNFKIGQSVELTDDGVWSLVWVKPTRSSMWPKLEKTILKWTDVERWKMCGNLIYLYGARRRVVINTILFGDGNRVVKFINNATKINS